MKRFFFAVGIAFLIASCSEEVETAAPDLDKASREITLTADITNGGWRGLTRAADGIGCDTVQKGRLLSLAGDSLVLLCTETESFLCRKDTVPFSSRYSLPLTRGSMKGYSNIEAEGFGVSCALYPVNGSYTEYGGGSYFFDQAVTAGTPTGYLWPSTDYRLAFYAYYPYGSSFLTLVSAASDNGSPTYGYTVPSDISTQLDIMTAQVTDHPGGPQRACQLPFTHHCAAVRVVFTNEKDAPLKVNSVAVSGVRYSGTLCDGTWTLDETVNSSVANPFVLSFGEGESIVPGGGETDKGSFEGTLTGTWTAGNTYTYNIILTDSFDFILNVTEPEAFTYEGGTDAFSVQSYKVKEDGTETKAVSWTVTYSTDGGETFSAEKPSWLTTSADAGDGGTVPTNITATVEPQIMNQEVYTTERYLKEADEVTDYDFSTKGGTQLMNTANCYFANGPGTYRLPLVYGNAIKDGEINEEAYIPNAEWGSLLNHADEGITNPWLKNNNATPDGAEIVWQDANGLVSDVAIEGDYLTFAIDKNTITGGNAVIAAKMGGTIVWSWHIWVTPETYTTTKETGEYQTAPANLGWIDLEEMTITDHPSRSCIVKVKQTGARGNEYIFQVYQKRSHAINIDYSKWGFCTYYQQLRKDPEPPYKNREDTDPEILTWGRKIRSVGYSIQHPTEVCGDSLFLGPFTNSNGNIWKPGNITKSIYDPCPPGFCVPPKAWAVYILSEREMTSLSLAPIGIGEMVIGINLDNNIWFAKKGYRHPRLLQYDERQWQLYDPNFLYYTRQHNRGYYWTSGTAYYTPTEGTLTTLGYCILFGETINETSTGDLNSVYGCNILPIREY